MTFEPEAEHIRLARVYSGMTDEELKALSAAAGQLTDVARQSLQVEIDRRGLLIVLAAPRGVDVLEQRDLVILRRFRDLPEAAMAKGSLESAGIECFLIDDNLIRMDWFYSNFVGGIKLLVNAQDAEDANAVLDQPIPESMDVEGIGEYQQPRCPACKSLDVSFQELNENVAYSSAYLGVPIPSHRKAWRCDACGHEWAETPDEQEKLSG